MSKIMRQMIKSNGVSYIKVAFMLILTIFLMNISIKVLTGIDPLLASVVAMIIVGLGILYIYNVVFYNMSNYVYKIISKDFIIERIIGKNNHMYYNLNFSEITKFEKCSSENYRIKVPRKYRFVHSKKKENWYFIESVKEGKIQRIIIEPEMGLLKSIRERLINNGNS